MQPRRSTSESLGDEGVASGSGSAHGQPKSQSCLAAAPSSSKSRTYRTIVADPPWEHPDTEITRAVANERQRIVEGSESA